MATLRAELEAARSRQTQLHRQLTGTESMLSRLRQEHRDLGQQLASSITHARNLQSLVDQLQVAITTLQQSRSWQLTRPLRAVLTLGRSLAANLRNPSASASEPAPPSAPAKPAEPVSEYQAWIERYATLDAAQHAAIAEDLAHWDRPPLLSIVMPVYNTPERFLRRAMESVRQQCYPHWELCIADDASSDPTVHAVLQEYAARDARIKLVWRKENGHIGAASNSALALASGEFVCLLDHDDVLTPHALYMVARAIRAYPGVDLLYSDEDKIDEQGRRFDPFFKPDWNPDLFLSYNYFNHFGVFRTRLMRDLGGFRLGYEGSEDYDLVLRAIARVGQDKVRHIPHVLYHWGAIPGSAAVSHSEKPYALQAAIQAVSEHLASQHMDAQVEESAPGSGTLRVRYALPAKLPLVSIIIPTRDGYALLRQCLESISAKTTYPHFEILVIDNGSEDPQVLDYLRTMAANRGIRVLRDDGPFNYSALNNAAARLAQGELLCLMNNDIEVISPDWLDEMVSQALRPDIGMVGCRLWYPDDSLQHAGVILGIGGVAGHAHHKLTRSQGGYFSRAQLVQNYSAITAACAVVRAAVFWQVNGFDAENLAVAFNDTDLCLRIGEAGYRNVWTPYAELYHHESASRGSEESPEKQARFAREIGHMLHRHGNKLLNDPAYNPNLALLHQDFTLAWPPRIHPLAATVEDTSHPKGMASLPG